MYHKITLVVAFGLAIMTIVAWASLESERKARAEVAKALEVEKKSRELSAAASPGAYLHTVIFRLKKDAPAGEADAMIADCHKLLAKIETVKQLYTGKPAEKDTPIVAVKDYHVALSVRFDDADGLTKYLDHALHQEFLTNHKTHFEKVLVYDFVQPSDK